MKLSWITTWITFLNQITSVDDFWKWSISKLAVGLRANNWYNDGQPYGLAGFINDFSSRVVGYATFRQLRVKNGKNIGYFLFFISILMKK